LGIPYGRFDNTTFPALGLQWRRVASLVGDIAMIGPTRWLAQILSSSSGQPVFKYRFNVTNPIAGFPDYDGAAHGVEVNFVFNDPDLKNTTELARVTDFMARSWVSFAVGLTPNNHGLENVPVWKEYDTLQGGGEFVVRIDSLSLEADVYRAEGIALINAANVDFVNSEH
jgi:acetylcholinesterase